MFFIIFGTRGVTSTKRRGHFHCPQCNETSPFSHKRVRRFFSLYFLPVLPLDLLGEYIECNHCKETYDLAVLRHEPATDGEEVDARFERAVMRTMAMMMMADGAVGDDKIHATREVYASLMERDISEDAVREEIQDVERAGRSLAEQLAQLAGGLSAEGKEAIVKAAFYVALADGTLHDEEQQLLVEIGKALGMTPAHLRGTIDSMNEEA